MNKKEVKKAPALRFKGFTNDWEQRKLKEVVNINPSTNVPNTFNYVDLNSVKGVSLIKVKKINKKEAPSRAQRVAKNGDIFYQMVRPYQKNNYLFNKPKTSFPYVFSTGYAQLRSIKTSPSYIFPLLQKSDFVNKVLAHSTGTSYPAINSRDLGQIKIYLPNELVEQNKIGEIFQKINKIIELQQRKLELLSLIKKTIIKHLFKLKNSDSLNLKFKTSCSQWNSKKLGEIAKFINGRAFKQSELLNKGKYPVLRVGNFYTNDKWFYSDLNLNKNKYADKGDLLYTWSATFGPHIWKGPKVIFHYHIWKIDFDPSIVNKTFLFYFLEADKENLLTNSNGSTMIHITKSNMENKIINLPQFSIQQNIGTFLSNLDYLINQEKIKSKQLIQLKRFLLQNMFI